MDKRQESRHEFSWTHLQNGINVNLVRIRDAKEGGIRRPRLKRCHSTLHGRMLGVFISANEYHLEDSHGLRETHQRQNSKSVENLLLSLPLFGKVNHALRAATKRFSIKRLRVPLEVGLHYIGRALTSATLDRLQLSSKLCR